LLHKGAQSDILSQKVHHPYFFFVDGAPSGFLVTQKVHHPVSFVQKVRRQDIFPYRRCTIRIFAAQKMHCPVVLLLKECTGRSFFVLQEKKSRKSFFVSKKVHRQVFFLANNAPLGFSSLSVHFYLVKIVTAILFWQCAFG